MNKLNPSPPREAPVAEDAGTEHELSTLDPGEEPQGEESYDSTDPSSLERLPSRGRRLSKRPTAEELYSWGGSDIFPSDEFTGFKKPVGRLLVSRLENGQEMADAIPWLPTMMRADLAREGGPGKYLCRLLPPEDWDDGPNTILARRTLLIKQGVKKLWPPAGRLPPDKPPRPLPQVSLETPRAASSGLVLAGVQVDLSSLDPSVALLLQFAAAVVPKAVETATGLATRALASFEKAQEDNRQRINGLEDRLLALTENIVTKEQEARREHLTRLKEVEDRQVLMLDQVFQQGIQYNLSFAKAIAEFQEKGASAGLPPEVAGSLAKVEGQLMDLQKQLGGRRDIAPTQLEEALNAIDAIQQRMRTQVAQYSASPNGPRGAPSGQGGGGFWGAVFSEENLNRLYANIDKIVAAGRTLLTQPENPRLDAGPQPPPPPRPAPQATVGTGVPMPGR